MRKIQGNTKATQKILLETTNLEQEGVYVPNNLLTLYWCLTRNEEWI